MCYGVQVYEGGAAREVTLGCHASILGLAVLYGRYAPRVPVRFSTQGCGDIWARKGEMKEGNARSSMRV